VRNGIDGDAFVAPTFGQRLGGRVLDSLFLAPVFAVLALVAHGATFWIVGSALIACYEIAGEVISGQTLGKRIVGTRVVSISSGSLRKWQAVTRALCYWAPTLFFLAIGLQLPTDAWTAIVILPILRPPLHRGLHDFAARTIVTSTRVAAVR